MLGSCSRFCLVVGVVCLLSVGCGQAVDTKEKPPAVSQVFRGQEVLLVVPRSLGLPGLWELLIQEWTSQSGASVRWKEFDATEESLASLIEEENSGGTFILFPLNQLSSIEGLLGALPGDENEFDSRNLFKGVRERGLTRDRKLVANPISAPVLSCYYRKDLLRAANLQAPETWDDYQRLVETVESWAPGLVAVEPLGPGDRATTFFARSLAYCKHPENYSVWFEIDSAKPAMDSPGFVRSLEKAQQTWKRLPAEVSNYTSADCRQQILKGKAAIGLAGEPISTELVSRHLNSGDQDSARIEGIEIGVCRLPGSRTVYNKNAKRWDALPGKEVHAPGLCGFAGLAAGVIDRKHAWKESAAANLLVSLNGPSLFDQAFATLPKGPCRESQLSFAPAWFGPELSSEEAGEYCDAVAQSLRDTQLVFELPVIGAAEFRQATSTALEPLLGGDGDPAAVADALQKSFEAIVERLGRDAVRDTYRRGLGLAPAAKK